MNREPHLDPALRQQIVQLTDLRLIQVNIGTVDRSVASRRVRAHPGSATGQKEMAGPDRDREEVIQGLGLPCDRVQDSLAAAFSLKIGIVGQFSLSRFSGTFRVVKIALDLLPRAVCHAN